MSENANLQIEGERYDPIESIATIHRRVKKLQQNLEYFVHKHHNQLQTKLNTDTFPLHKIPSKWKRFNFEIILFFSSFFPLSSCDLWFFVPCLVGKTDFFSGFGFGWISLSIGLQNYGGHILVVQLNILLN